MSAWSQAVWIVKQLQANFDFTQEISNYIGNLNTLNGRVNELNNTVQETKNNLLSRALVITGATKPTGEEFLKDTIFLKIEEGQNG